MRHRDVSVARFFIVREFLCKTVCIFMQKKRDEIGEN